MGVSAGTWQREEGRNYILRGVLGDCREITRVADDGLRVAKKNVSGCSIELGRVARGRLVGGGKERLAVPTVLAFKEGEATYGARGLELFKSRNHDDNLLWG